jgi:hypothetical protein
VTLRVLYVEFRLEWLIDLAQLEMATPARRLNAIENLTSQLTRQWRGTRSLVLSQDFQLSRATFHALFAWVHRRAPVSGPSAARLHSITTSDTLDNSVPEGWIRVLLQMRNRAD